MNWWRGLKNSRVKLGERLARHTTLRIGGPAKFFIEPRDEEALKLLISRAKRCKIPVLVLGAGSNILAGDNWINRAVVKLSAPFFKKVAFKGDTAEAGGGLALAGLISQAKNRGLGGGEFLSGIPGTVGGALAMNAGAWGRDIGSLVRKVRVMDYSGRVKELDKGSLGFGYRKSRLKNYIILGATLKFVKREKQKIQNDLSRFRRQRELSQDIFFPSAGCIFKNPPDGPAGKMIESAGLKGRSIGGACISDRHANFILNRNNASAADFLQLMRLAKKEVKKKFGITLQPEIKIWR